jgi:hypothetical protein
VLAGLHTGLGHGIGALRGQLDQRGLFLHVAQHQRGLQATPAHQFQAVAHGVQREFGAIDGDQDSEHRSPLFFRNVNAPSVDSGRGRPRMCGPLAGALRRQPTIENSFCNSD